MIITSFVKLRSVHADLPVPSLSFAIRRLPPGTVSRATPRASINYRAAR